MEYYHYLQLTTTYSSLLLLTERMKYTTYHLLPTTFEVECVQRVGVSDARWRKWQRTISTMLLAQNGAISEALLLWRQHVDKVFEGVEECPICYTIIHAATRALPKLECRTCHHKFHAACLYKWFNSSQKSNCPLCQSTF